MPSKKKKITKRKFSLKKNKMEVPEVDQAHILEEPTPDMTTREFHEDLKELIEKNIKWSQVVYSQNKAIKHRLTMMVLLNYIKIIIILTPIILGIIYLPPLIADMLAQYNEVINNGASFQDAIQKFLNKQ